MEPGQAQLKEAIRPLLHSAGPTPMGRAAGVGCAARKVAVKVEGIDRLDSSIYDEHGDGQSLQCCVNAVVSQSR